MLRVFSSVIPARITWKITKPIIRNQPILLFLIAVNIQLPRIIVNPNTATVLNETPRNSQLRRKHILEGLWESSSSIWVHTTRFDWSRKISRKNKSRRMLNSRMSSPRATGLNAHRTISPKRKMPSSNVLSPLLGAHLQHAWYFSPVSQGKDDLLQKLLWPDASW